MKNYEKYANEIREYEGSDFCEDFVIPYIFNSKDICKNMNCNACNMLRMIWLFEDYKEPEVDWSKVEVDTPILVREDDNDEWGRRYFARYKNGTVYAWIGGCTSWSETNMGAWKYAKLAEGGEE